MADLVNLFKEKADEFLATINQKGGVRATLEGLRRQMAEADRRRAIGRVKAELRRLDRQIGEMVTAVGVQAVALQEAGQLSSPELQPLCQHILDLKATLNEQREELARLDATASVPVAENAPGAARATICTNCGRPVPAGGAFCPYCGAASAPAASPEAAVAPTPGASSSPGTLAGPGPEARTRSAVCAHCGAPLKPGAKFCSKCGHAV